MKPAKYLLFTLLFSVFCLSAQAQLTTQQYINAQRKYWYYRYRLLNDFMLEGNCQGCSIPADERDQNDKWKVPNPSDPEYQKFEKLYNGHSVLSFGEDAKTLGLYIGVLATEYKMLEDNNENLDSIKRELYYAMKTVNRLDLEGEIYFSGSGVLNGFIVRDDIHQGFLKNHYAHFNSGKTSPLTVDTLTSNYVTEMNKRNSNCSNQPLGQDDFVRYIIGLVLVNRLLNSSDNYEGFHFVQQSRNMITRIVSRLASLGWFVVNPVNQHFLCASRGGWVQTLSYPFSKIGCQAATSSNCWLMNDAYPIIWEALTNLIPHYPCYSNCSNTAMYFPLAALGNSGKNLLGLNNTKRMMGKAMVDRKEDSPLLWGLLWGKRLDNLPYYSNPLGQFDNLLNDAPCVGPYWFPSIKIPAPYTATYASYDWSTRDRYGNGGALGNANKASGEYNGLDYMLLFNLYYLYYGETGKSWSQNLPLYYDMMDVHTNDISSVYPYFNSNHNLYWGNSTHPAYIDAFRSITSKAHIESNGVVTMRAGEVINMLPGFTTKPGAYFHAYIKPFHCSSVGNSGAYQRTSAPDSSGLYGMNSTIPNGQNHFKPVKIPAYAQEQQPVQPHYTKAMLDSLKAAGYINEAQYSQLLGNIQPTNPSSNISVYPNPSHQIFNVTVSGNNANLQNIRIFDALGRQINPKIEQTSDNSVRIDMSRYAKGIYLLRMGAAVKQLVLE